MALNKKIVKFVEALWRFLFYSYFCYLGYRSLFLPTTVSWVLDSKENWNGWPHHKVSDAISYYYLIELGAYIHQLMWTEVSRSDSIEMITHHMVSHHITWHHTTPHVVASAVPLSLVLSSSLSFSSFPAPLFRSTFDVTLLMDCMAWHDMVR